MDKNRIDAYLKFDRSRMVNLEYSLEREVLRTNRRGAYHCTTLVECNTRKQHGLLVMPVPNLDDSNHVLLSSFDETVIQHGAEFNLGLHKYDGDNYSPMGHKYIREFSCDSLPRTIYRVGGVILSKEKMFSLENNTIFIRYKLLDAHSPTTLRFRPLLAFRGINELTYENSTANHGYKEISNGISMCMYSGYPELYMQFNKSPQFVFAPCWYKGIEYKKDMEEGVPYKEDLYVPGYFELPIKKGETIIFSASDTLAQPEAFLHRFDEGVTKRTPRSSFFNCLKNSGHQFYFRPSKGQLYLLNKYPWGKVAARDQFIALSGLTLCIDKPEAFEEIVDTAIPYINKLLKNELITGYLKDIDQPDVLLWLIVGLKKFSDAHKEQFMNKYALLVKRIIDFIQADKHPYIDILPNKLLSVDSYRQASDWMNISLDKKSLVKRTGCLVEMNAAWYNAIMFAIDIAKEWHDQALEKELTELASIIKVSFNEIFVNNAGYLYDYVDGSYVDWSVRPNMLLAISVDYPLVDKHISKSILEMITKELLTPKGLRTLSPKSTGFSPRYEGTRAQKDYSVMNGAAWPWLLGPYLSTYNKIFQRSGYAFLDRLLIGIEEEMANDCIASISEFYDGSLPYQGHGAVSSALNVAGVLYALRLQESLSFDY